MVDELPSCTLATGATVVDVEQDSDQVRVTVAAGAGQRTVVTGSYLIGCDGPRSKVRERIGAAYVGDHALRPNLGMVFRAPGLWTHVGTARPSTTGSSIPTRPRWWARSIRWIPGGSSRSALITTPANARPVGSSTPRPGCQPVRIRVVHRSLDSANADRRPDAPGPGLPGRGRADLNPPFGGHGLNTGLGDAVDLGWKIAATLDGWAGPELLDSYEIERGPIQERVIREATLNMG